MALSEVQLSQAAPVPLAVVRRQAHQSQLSKLVQEGCGTVWTYLRSHQLRGGRNIAVYLDGTIRLEVGVEMAEAFPESADVVRSATPSGPVASVVHLGPYQQLGGAHKAIQEWCAANNRRPAGPQWEIYGHWQEAWNTDPSKIRTDVCYLLAQ